MGVRCPLSELNIWFSSAHSRYCDGRTWTLKNAWCVVLCRVFVRSYSSGVSVGWCGHSLTDWKPPSVLRSSSSPDRLLMTDFRNINVTFSWNKAGLTSSSQPSSAFPFAKCVFPFSRATRHCMQLWFTNPCYRASKSALRYLFSFWRFVVTKVVNDTSPLCILLNQTAL